MMMNFPAEISADLLSPSTEIAQALIEAKSTTDPDAMSRAGAIGSTEAIHSDSIAPLLMSAPISRPAMVAILSALPFVCVLLILLSRWRLPAAVPPIEHDPARHLHRSLL